MLPREAGTLAKKKYKSLYQCTLPAVNSVQVDAFNLFLQILFDAMICVERFFSPPYASFVAHAYPVIFGSVPEDIFTEKSDVDIIIVFVNVKSHDEKNGTEAEVMNPLFQKGVVQSTLRKLCAYLEYHIQHINRLRGRKFYFDRIVYAKVPILKSYPSFRKLYKIDTDITITYDGVYSTLWCILHMTRDHSKRDDLDVRCIWLQIRQQLIEKDLTVVMDGGLSKYGYQVMMFNFLVEEHWLPKMDPTLVQEWADTDLPKALVSPRVPIYTIENQRKLYSDAAAKIYSQCAATDIEYQNKNLKGVKGLKNRILLYIIAKLESENFTLNDPINNALRLVKDNFNRQRALKKIRELTN